MRLREAYLEFSALLSYLQGLALLFGRFVVAYGFYEPALLKWSNFETTVTWFESLGIPFASFATFMTASIETLGVVLLTLGLFVRFITFPLIVILLVAIVAVHLSHGFPVGNNGFEIPLYYIIFLFLFATHGAGSFSLDALFFKREQ